MRRSFNLSLHERHIAFIAEELAAGRAQNASEVVRRALELAIREREQYEARLTVLRAALAEADAEIERGEATLLEPGELEEIFATAISRVHAE